LKKKTSQPRGLLYVKPIQQLLDDATGSVSYHFSVKPVDAAVKLLGEQYWKLIRSADASSFDIAVDESKVPEITTKLATGGIQIIGISKNESSLEDAFISLTGGGNTIE
jgi:ABC-type multidrug transport system ATPase subunit